MVIGARVARVSISKTASLVGFRKYCDQAKTSRKKGTCGREQVIDERGQRRMSRMVRTNRRCNQAICS